MVAHEGAVYRGHSFVQVSTDLVSCSLAGSLVNLVTHPSIWKRRNAHLSLQLTTRIECNNHDIIHKQNQEIYYVYRQNRTIGLVQETQKRCNQ